MKPCRKCGGTFDLSAFFKHKGMADGHLNTCKSCCALYDRKRREEHPERLREYELRRNQTEHRKNQAREVARKMVTKHPLRRAAHIAVGNAVRDKKLVKQPCVVCGTLKVEAHHPDYSLPLEVVWLCIKHHKELHRMELPQ